MKKFFSLLLIAVMCTSFAACGGESNNTEMQSNSGSTASTGSTTTDTTTDTTMDTTTDENNSTSEDTIGADTVNPIDPDSPEGRVIAELDAVKEYFSTHFASNDKWYPQENDINIWVEMTTDGKFQCMYMGMPSRFWNFAWLLESYKLTFGVDGTFSWNGDDVVYTLADGSASVTWKDIDAFDIDAYQQSDEYKEILKQSRIAAMKQELNHFVRIIENYLIVYNNNWEISDDIFVTKDANGKLTVSAGTIADAFNSCDEMNFSGTFTMDGDTLVYVNNEDSTISVTWDEAVN